MTVEPKIPGAVIPRRVFTQPGLEVDIRHRKTVGVADDVRDAAILLDCPRWWEAALGHSFLLPSNGKEGQGDPLSTG